MSSSTHTTSKKPALSGLRAAVRSSKLSTRIAVAASILFLIALLVLGFTSMHEFRARLKEVLIEQQRTFVQRVADNLEQKLLLLQSGLVLSAKTVRLEDVESSDAAQRFLDANTGLHALFERSVFLFSPKGDLIAEYPFRPGRRGQNFAFRGYIRDTVSSGKPVISEPFRTTKTDHDDVLMLTAPVYSREGKMIAILSGSLGLTRPGMLGNIAKTVIGQTGYLYLVTDHGKLIMHPDRSRLAQRAFAEGKFPEFERALRGQTGTTEAREPDGTEVLATFESIPTPGWILAARYPVNQAFLPYRNMTRSFFEWLMIGSAVVLAALFSLTRRYLGPLETLTREIRRRRNASESTNPVSIVALGEIGDLARAFNDLMERLRNREEALVEASSRYKVITENSTDLITLLSPDGGVTYASPICLQILNISAHQLNGHAFEEFIHPKERELFRHTLSQSKADGLAKTVSYRIRTAEHQYIWFETTMSVMSVNGAAVGELLCVSRDITEHKRVESHLYAQERRDAITQLPNRLLLEETINRCFSDTRRQDDLSLALILIDFDRFKNINDSLGHSTGDALLKLAANRIAECIRPQDFVARWGGDEFVLLLRDVKNTEMPIEIAERCLSSLRRAFELDSQSLHLSASMGICLYPSGGDSCEQMLKNVDTAMYRAKQQGGDTYVIYVPEMNAKAHGRLALENDLHYAIERQELVLYYQPMISAVTGRLTGAETLVRWIHPTRAMLPPDDFIPIAEDSGLIEKIGEWVLCEACEQMVRWRAQGLPPLRVSVNLSCRQFRRSSLVDTVRQALESTGIEPEFIELEVTETALMEDPVHSAAVIDELKRLGVQISIDDFGTGYSSLNYLRMFKVDALKIDRSFVSELGDEHSGVIVGATIGIAKNLRLRTVAEGVETKEQMDYLLQQGCDEMQGFLFGNPIPADEFYSAAGANAVFMLAHRSRSVSTASEDA